MTTPPTLTTRPGPGYLIVELRGPLDFETVPGVRPRLNRIVADGARTVVLDLTEVPQADSSALSLIAWLHKQLLARGGGVCIAGPQPSVRHLLEVTAIDRLIPVYPDTAAAVARLT